MPDPSGLQSTWTLAVLRIVGAIEGRRGIAVFGDYDVERRHVVGAFDPVSSARSGSPSRRTSGRRKEGYGRTRRRCGS